MKIPGLKRFDRVEVTLLDLTYMRHWRYADEVEKEKAWVIHLLGYYLNHDKIQLRICALYVPAELENVADVHLIPIGAITSIKKI